MAVYLAKREYARQLALARIRALEKESARRIKEQADSDQARLALADQFRDEGDLRTATKTYVRLVLSRRDNEATAQAKQRIVQLQERAMSELAAIDQKLAAVSSSRSEPAAGDSSVPNEPAELEVVETDEQLLREFEASRRAFLDDLPLELPADPDTITKESGLNPAPDTQEAVEPESAAPETIRDPRWYAIESAFREYENLSRKYAYVPAAGDKIAFHVKKQRQVPEFSEVLNEPEAIALLGMARQHESQNQLCCAYLAYESAVRLVPAPSAVQAGQRLAQLRKDPDVVASAEACSELQWCHKTFRHAETLAEVSPKRARELFSKIVRRAPSDTQVHRAARKRLQQLGASS